MPEIPVKNRTQQAMEGAAVKSLPRPYIGYSGLNDPCPRALWYSFRWIGFRVIEPRLQRIFDRGDLEEKRIITDLTAKGMHCYALINHVEVPITGEIGEPQEEFIGIGGHVHGHSDGRVIGVPDAPKTPHLLEIKTMKASKFRDYKKFGLEKVHPRYWGQIHSYMGKANLTRTLFCVTNKDTEERSFERYKFDEDVYKDMEAIAVDILTSEVPPQKIGDATWFECRFCDWKQQCHHGAEILKTCRTCEHASIEDYGVWRCLQTDLLLSKKDQFCACKKYVKMECL